MFDVIGKELVKSVISAVTGGQKMKLSFEPPEGKMLIRHSKPDGSNHTYEITFGELTEMMKNG